MQGKEFTDTTLRVARESLARELLLDRGLFMVQIEELRADDLGGQGSGSGFAVRGSGLGIKVWWFGVYGLRSGVWG